jgi:hypothetical protein
MVHITTYSPLGIGAVPEPARPTTSELADPRGTALFAHESISHSLVTASLAHIRTNLGNP